MKIGYTQINQWGRLGNNLFQVASLLGLAHKYKAKPCIPTNWKYRQYVSLPEEYYEDINPQQPIEETHIHYLPDLLEPYKKNDIIDLTGCLQSEKYFIKIKDNIEKWFTPNDLVDLGENSVSIHWRLGDYKFNKNYVNYGAGYFLSVIQKYFKDSKYTLYVCSDDIEHCKLHFKGDQFIIKQRSEIDDLKILIGCRNHIMSNSTFSWWGTYLSKPGGINIRPPKIFAGPLEKYIETDFWQPEWIIHDEKLDLKDVTFIIPVRYDHPDRKENLKITTDFLKNNFDTNIIIGEQSGDYFKNFGYRYVKFPYLEFQRTKMLNRMTELSSTPIVVNWDADILLSPCQVFEMIQMLRKDFDFVYPYDGRFLRVGEGTYKRIPELIEKLKNGDIGNVLDYKFIGEDDNSSGGAIGYKKESFIKAGMENEKFIAYAPEDVERKYRFETLGFKVGRIWGALYHLNHYCSAISNPSNPFYKDGIDELNNVISKNKEQLQQYIKTWEWLDQRKVYLICYADDKFKEEQERLISSVDGMFDKIFAYDRKWLETTIFYKTNKKLLDEEKGGGNCVWKPFIILDVISKIKDNDIILYIDSADIIKGDIRTFLLSETKENEIVLTNGGFKNSDWTKMDCFVTMDCAIEKYMNAIQLEAGVCVFKKTDRIIGILSEWLLWCQQSMCISAKNEYKFENTPGFKEHRYDQSILTNLKIRYDLYSSDVIRRFVTCNVPLRTKLSDVTFIIPLFYDGKDRKNNLNAVVKYIQSNTGAKIIIGEQLEDRFNYFGNVKYIRFDKMMEFHRTKMINDMTRMCDTEIVVVCDADVIIPLSQYDEAIRIISNNEADVVYPYDKFVKLNKVFTDKFLRNIDCDELSGIGTNSYGGMIFFNKDQFIRSGMYNTNFICWGVEDVEIYHRLNKLGFVVKRIEGNIYHLNHYRGINSSNMNDHYQNNVKEYQKVKVMSKEELEKYVKNNFK